MPQCKVNGCREQARPIGKRYCEKHYQEYLAKQKLHRERQAALPDCESGIAPACQGKVSQTRVDLGLTICGNCEHEINRLSDENAKEQEFQDAETVEELKEWMVKYLLA